MFAYAKKDVSACDAEKTQQYLLKCLSHRIKAIQNMQPSASASAEAQRVPSCRGMATTEESATLLPSEVEEPKYHSSGTLMPPPPDSGLGKDHPYAHKVVNTSEVQLVQPRVPHPVSNEHAMQCMRIVNELEQMEPNKDFSINTNITDKLTLWLCPPGFSWSLTFDTVAKRQQAFAMAQNATEILNMRIRREARARDMAQKRMDASAAGTFDCFRYDIEREYQLLKKFRRALFFIELGPKATSEMERIKRLEAACTNTGITPAEQALFKKLMKARLQAVVEAVAVEQSPKKPKPARNKCSYCKKRHAGGPSQCRKRKADEKARRANKPPTQTAQQQQPPQPKAQSGSPRTSTVTQQAPATKRKKVTVTKNTAGASQDP